MAPGPGGQHLALVGCGAEPILSGQASTCLLVGRVQVIRRSMGSLRSPGTHDLCRG